MSSKTKTRPFRDQNQKNPGIPVLLGNTHYIEFSRIVVDYSLNGRSQMSTFSSVDPEDAQGAANIGIQEPIGVLKLKETMTMPDGTIKNKALLISGFRRYTMVSMAMQDNLSQENGERAAFLGEDGEAYLPVRDLAGIKHLDLTNEADNMLYQLQANNHEAWPLADRIRTAVKLIDVLKVDSKGNKLTQDLVADYLGVNRVLVAQQYLPIGRAEGMLDILHHLPQTQQVLKYLANKITKDGIFAHEILKVVQGLEATGKVTITRLKDHFGDNPTVAIKIEDNVADTMLPKEVEEINTDDNQKEGTKPTPVERYNFMSVMESVVGRVSRSLPDNKNGRDVKSLLNLILLAKNESMDVDTLTWEIQQIVNKK
ncbi:MAG: hypothetical protein AAFO96_03870 [Bacteroidota bacterium]